MAVKLFIDNWFKFGYRGFVAKLNTLSFEQVPLVMAHTFLIWHDATKPCSQRQEWQATCGDSSCQNCDNNFVDVADLDLQYLSGELALDFMTQLASKSGRRRLLMSEEHCQMSIADLDMERLREFSTGWLTAENETLIFISHKTSYSIFSSQSHGWSIAYPSSCGIKNSAA